MVKFLTDEWVSALDHAAGAHVSLVSESFVVEYRVDMEDGDPFVYQIRFDGGSVAATRSSTATPTVVLTTDRATARRIASNDLSAQAAFMAGQVRLDGDTMALVRNHDALARLDEVFNDVRLLTEY